MNTRALVFVLLPATATFLLFTTLSPTTLPASENTTPRVNQTNQQWRAEAKTLEKLIQDLKQIRDDIKLLKKSFQAFEKKLSDLNERIQRLHKRLQAVKSNFSTR